jgi:hypothetical protein
MISIHYHIKLVMCEDYICQKFELFQCQFSLLLRKRLWANFRRLAYIAYLINFIQKRFIPWKKFSDYKQSFSKTYMCHVVPIHMCEESLDIFHSLSFQIRQVWELSLPKFKLFQCQFILPLHTRPLAKFPRLVYLAHFIWFVRKLISAMKNNSWIMN